MMQPSPSWILSTSSNENGQAGWEVSVLAADVFDRQLHSYGTMQVN